MSFQDCARLAETFTAVRKASEKICETLELEDYLCQAMSDVSPPKWHLSHTTWFFERFLLQDFVPHYIPFDVDFDRLFNSYYQSLGKTLDRSLRGMLSRPSLAKVLRYREHVDQAVLNLLSDSANDRSQERILWLVWLGLQHEKQHQELLWTDIKYNFFCHPLQPAMLPARNPIERDTAALHWLSIPSAVHSIGSSDPFCFDLETPRHQVFLHPMKMASRLVTNAEYSEFIRDGGYAQVLLWLSEGWQWVQAGQRQHPLYWQNRDNDWYQFTIHGWEPLNPAEPVCHLSYFEAEAFASWSKARLPTEQEWEVFASHTPVSSRAHFSPMTPLTAAAGDLQLYSEVWQWTSSALTPYPGYKPWQGQMAEYNAKFMVNQYVLRGGSCASPSLHLRPSYRNFFSATSQWQFTGIRLAKDKWNDEKSSSKFD